MILNLSSVGSLHMAQWHPLGLVEYQPSEEFWVYAGTAWNQMPCRSLALQEWYRDKNEPPFDKTNKVAVRPVKTQISLGICPVWLEPLLCVHWVAKDPTFLHADSEDSDQTGRMPRLIWVVTGRTLILLVLSCHGSNMPGLQLTDWFIINQL